MRSLAVIALALWACEPSGSAPAGDPEEARAIAARAQKLAAAAAAAEPAISERVRGLAREAGGQLAGFEHRLKPLASLERKIRSRTRADPGLTIAEPDIVDALRYTIVVEPDRYTAAIRAVLEALEADGHRIVRVKNYWPRGDNYSGVNTVIARGDLQWEIQFHTPESAAVRDVWHPAYEQLRELETPRSRRRFLFALMAMPWEQVEIPPGAQQPGNLHATEQIRRYPSP